MDPQQELFSALLLELKKQYPGSVYDTFLPSEGTPYPFVYLADSDLNDRANKTAVFGIVSQTIHVWHDNPRQRGTVSQMILQIKQICRPTGTYRQLLLVRAGLESENIAGHNYQPATSSRHRGSDFFIQLGEQHEKNN